MGDSFFQGNAGPVTIIADKHAASSKRSRRLIESLGSFATVRAGADAGGRANPKRPKYPFEQRAEAATHRG